MARFSLGPYLNMHIDMRSVQGSNCKDMNEVHIRIESSYVSVSNGFYINPLPLSFHAGIQKCLKHAQNSSGFW